LHKILKIQDYLKIFLNLKYTLILKKQWKKEKKKKVVKKEEDEPVIRIVQKGAREKRADKLLEERIKQNEQLSTERLKRFLKNVPQKNVQEKKGVTESVVLDNIVAQEPKKEEISENIDYVSSQKTDVASYATPQQVSGDATPRFAERINPLDAGRREKIRKELTFDKYVSRESSGDKKMSSQYMPKMHARDELENDPRKLRTQANQYKHKSI